MISKELLDEVLKEKVLFIGSINKSILNYEVYSDFTCDKVAYGEINIYELAHKCKEWAFNKGGIDITSGKRLGLDGWECLVFFGVIPCDCYEADTEPEAIFKACQWILENR